MTVRTIAASVGAGITAFLVVGAATTELLAESIAFSALVGIPVGLLAAALAALVTYSIDRDAIVTAEDATPIGRLLAAVSGFGYAVVVLLALQYAVPATRSTLTTRTVVGLGLLVAVVASLATGIGRRRDESTAR